jgi:hypothetical protein
MNPQEVFELIKMRGYLPLAIIVVGYLARLTSDMSKFPIDIPKRAQPLVVVVLGQAYAVLLHVSTGARWQEAVINGLLVSFLTMGLFDLVVKAIFGGKEPAWLARLAFIFPASKKSEDDEDNRDTPKLPPRDTA